MPVLLVERFASHATSQLGDECGIINCAEDADEAMSLLQQETYELVLIGMTSSPEDGFDLIRRLQASGNETPVLALMGSAPDEELDGVDMLADPIDPDELRTRVTSILRRGRETAQPILWLGELSLCLLTREAQSRETPLALSANEFAMLELLVRRKGPVLTKATFLNHMYGEAAAPEARIVDVLMHKLRAKLEQAGAGQLVSVVWGHGYMIRELGSLPPRLNDTVTINSYGLVA